MGMPRVIWIFAVRTCQFVPYADYRLVNGKWKKKCSAKKHNQPIDKEPDKHWKNNNLNPFMPQRLHNLFINWRPLPIWGCLVQFLTLIHVSMEHVYSIGEEPDQVPAYSVSYLRMQRTRRLILVCTICPCPIKYDRLKWVKRMRTWFL